MALIVVPPAMPADHADLPIAEAASEVMEIERSGPLDEGFDVTLGDTITDPGVRAIFSKQERTASIRNYRFRGVTLDVSTMLLVRGRRRIRETFFLMPEETYADMLTKPLLLTELDPTRHYIIGSNRAWHNYYHWMHQSLPAIDVGLRQARDRGVTLLLPPSLRPWQEETLNLLGYQDIPRMVLDVAGHYLLASAEFSDFLSGPRCSMVSRVAPATHRRMSEKVPRLPDAAEEIYVARTDTDVRVMVNEPELIELLLRQGVRIIVPGKLSISEQIATFRAARLVLGPHGAGLTNLVFCRSGAFVYELLPSHYPNIVFNRVAQEAGLNYVADVFESFGEGDFQLRTWRVDLDVVARRLDAIRQRIAATPRIETAMEFLRRTQMAQQPEVATAKRPPKPAPAAVPRQRPAGFLRRAVTSVSRLMWRRRRGNSAAREE